jgi:glycosyltransferase involved in cell wall biosynthesis
MGHVSAPLSSTARRGEVDGSVIRDRPALLHVFPTFAVGGAQRRFAQIAGATAHLFRHLVLALDAHYEACETLQCRVETLGEVEHGGHLGRRVARAMARLRIEAPSLVITHNWGAIEWTLAARLARLPHLHIEDGFGPDEANRQLIRRVWFRRLVLSGSFALVVPSRTLERIARDIWRLPKNRIRYIPNGIEVDGAEPRETRRTLGRLALGLPEGVPIVGWVGGLRPEKNLGRLLRACARLPQEVILVLIGEGPERASVEAQARSLGLTCRVLLLGARGDVESLMPAFDVFALSSDTEQMPIVVLEAMRAGLPVASVDVGDVWSMVCADNQRFITQPSDDAFSQALADLLASRELRTDLGAANYALVREAFPLSRMIDSYTALYRAALEHKGGPREASDTGRPRPAR